MTIKPFTGATRREFLSGGLSITMLAASAPREATESPVIPLVPGPEVDAFKEAQGRLLAKDHVTARSRFVRLPKPPLSVHVLVGGEGAPVLLIHGGAAIAAQWSPLLAELQREFHWFAPDRPGCGLTDKFDYSKGTPFKQHAREFVGSIMDALGLRHASLVGNSMGGYWALLFALAEPDRVDKLVLLGSPAASLPPDQRPRRPPAHPRSKGRAPRCVLNWSPTSIACHPRCWRRPPPDTASRRPSSPGPRCSPHSRARRPRVLLTPSAPS